LPRSRVTEIEFGFGGSIVLGRRFLLSVVLALSLSTLASADSTNGTAALLQAGTGAYGAANTRFTSNSGTATPTSMLFVANSSSAANGNTRLSGPPFGNIMYDWKITASAPTGIPSVRLHTNFRLRTSEWNIAEGGPGLSTPEPVSLLLLSTGLIGIAGLMRRKLRA
jgi:hypothetical protein